MRILFAGDFSSVGCADTLDEVSAREIAREILPLFRGADYRVLNQENVLCERGVGAPIVKSGPNLWGNPKNVGFLRALGIDLAVLANNHFGDYGEDAALATIDTLRRAGIGYVGGGENIEAAYRAAYAEGEGARLAILAVCENEFGCARRNKAGAAGFEIKRLADRIAEEKRSSDYVVVIFHGGNEYNPVPSPSTVERYRFLIDLGADAVIAMHTHCMQGYETYAGKPIVYSTGNFYFPSYADRNKNLSWNCGYLVEMIAERGKPLSVRPIPYRVELDGRTIHPLDGEQKEAILAYLDKISAPIADPEELSRLYDAWCIEAGVNGYAIHLSSYGEYLGKPDSEQGMAQLAKMRNLFTCEAHAALMRNTLTLTLDGELETAETALPKLKELQRIPL